MDRREAQLDVGRVGRDPALGLRLLRVHVGEERIELHDAGVVRLRGRARAPGEHGQAP